MITEKDLGGFLSMHAAFRTEFGRLADACSAPRNATERELVEEHIALVVDILHAHHTHEDEHLWPFLAARSPQSRAELDELEAEHTILDPLIRASVNTSRPLTERAEPLRRLHQVLNEHLDHEERVAVPLMLEHYTPEMVQSDRHKAKAEIGRRRVAHVFGWVASCLDDEQLETTLAEHPRVVRFLFHTFWWPAYQRRMRTLYGPSVRPASRALAGSAAA